MIPFVEWTTLRRDGNGMNVDSSSVRRFSRFNVVIVLDVIWWSGRRRNVKVGNECEHDVDRMHTGRSPGMKQITRQDADGGDVSCFKGRKTWI